MMITLLSKTNYTVDVLLERTIVMIVILERRTIEGYKYNTGEQGDEFGAPSSFD